MEMDQSRRATAVGVVRILQGSQRWIGCCRLTERRLCVPLLGGQFVHCMSPVDRVLSDSCLSCLV